MAGRNYSNEPQPDRWYNLTLGSSFQDDPPSKFCTLRYEFKPASIDKDQRGSLHKRKDNKVTVEFQNNQPGKPKVIFEGITEDYKENDAVLFFDGESLRLERLHRNVKRLRFNRAQGESIATSGVPEASSPPLEKGNKPHSSNRDTFHPLALEVERLEVGEFKASDTQIRHERTIGYPAAQPYTSFQSPDHVDIVNNVDDAIAAPVGVTVVEVAEYDGPNIEVTEYETANVDGEENETGYGEDKEYDTGIDINKPQADGDDEIDLSDDEETKGLSAAEKLKAQNPQINPQINPQVTPTSSSSDDSSESSSGSGSSSSDGESSDADTVNSI